MELARIGAIALVVALASSPNTVEAQQLLPSRFDRLHRSVQADRVPAPHSDPICEASIGETVIYGALGGALVGWLLHTVAIGPWSDQRFDEAKRVKRQFILSAAGIGVAIGTLQRHQSCAKRVDGMLTAASHPGV